MGEGGGLQSDGVVGEAVSHTLNGLRGNTEYEIEVFVVSAVGRSIAAPTMARTNSEGKRNLASSPGFLLALRQQKAWERG